MRHPAYDTGLYNAILHGLEGARGHNALRAKLTEFTRTGRIELFWAVRGAELAFARMQIVVGKDAQTTRLQLGTQVLTLAQFKDVPAFVAHAAAVTRGFRPFIRTAMATATYK